MRKTGRRNKKCFPAGRDSMKPWETGYYFENSRELNVRSKSAMPWELLGELEKIKPKKTASPKKWEKKHVVLKGKVEIADTAEIAPFCVIEGPCIIMDNAVVRPHAWIRGPVIIGKDSVIGKGCEIKNSIIGNNAKIGTNCFVGDSILGKGARIGSGTILSNRRFDQKEIKIKLEGKEFNTGKDKFGAIIGDYSRIGANCSFSPGTIVGMHSWVIATNVHGFLERDKLHVEKNGKIESREKERVELKDTDVKGRR